MNLTKGVFRDKFGFLCLGYGNKRVLVKYMFVVKFVEI